MIIGVAGLKGGIGKTITAIHLAAYFSRLGSTLLLDVGGNGCASIWAQHAKSLPFNVVRHKSEEDDDKVRAYGCKYNIIDVAYPVEIETLAAVGRCAHVTVVPCFPEAGSLETIRKVDRILEKSGSTNHRVLLTNVPPWPQRDGAEARHWLKLFEFPLFHTEITTSTTFDRAFQKGCTAMEFASDARHYRAWAQYEALGREIEALLPVHSASS